MDDILADSPFDLRLFQPKGRLSSYIQGVWSASVPAQGSGEVKRWLHSDAGSGILFNLGGDMYLGDSLFSTGVILLPVRKQAQSITLPPGSQLAGVRFHPAIGFGVLGALYNQPTAIMVESDAPFAMCSLCERVINTTGHYARIAILYRWLNLNIDFFDVMPSSLEQALHAVQKRVTPGQLSENIPLSQRQLERQFKRWMGMSPKHYQRILRVKNSLHALKLQPNTDLANLALHNGFTDQAHMTREFQNIAQITPKKYSNLVINQHR